MNRKARIATPWILAAGLAACVTTHDKPAEIYENIGQAMEAEVEPFAETLLPRELTKDPGSVQFSDLESRARRVAEIFEQMQDTTRALYEPDEKIRDHAKTAAAYFSSLATAAASKDHAKLVQLAVRKGKICAHCHS